MLPESFENTVVIVTGAASGIGRAIITAFVRAGAKGVIADLDKEWSHTVAEKLKSEGGDVIVSITDISQPDQIDFMLHSVLDTWGHLDVFINNAGVGVHKEVVELTDADWDHQMNVQLRGSFLCSRAAARQMMNIALELQAGSKDSLNIYNPNYVTTEIEPFLKIIEFEHNYFLYT